MEKENNITNNENNSDMDNQEISQNDSDDNPAYNCYSDGGWIQWFCQLEGNEFFVEIDEEYLQNLSNIVGLTKSFDYK